MKPRFAVLAACLAGVLALGGCTKFKRTKECNAFIDKVNAALKEIEKRPAAAQADEGAAVSEMRELAKLYEQLAKDITALAVTNEELAKHATEYQQMATKAAATARQVADAFEANDVEKATVAQKQFDAIVKQEDQLVSSINGLCQQ